MRTIDEFQLVKGQSWTWLKNIYDPREEDHEQRNVAANDGNHTKEYEEDLHFYKEWLKDKFIGNPKSEEEYAGKNVEELKKEGLVGIYKPGPILSSITRRAQAGIPPCPISRSEFKKWSKPIKVYLQLSDESIPETLLFEPKWDYTSGSYGWQKSVKLPHTIIVDGNPIEIKLQFVCNIVVVGSKEMPKERSE